MTEDWTKEIKERLEAATPGPWRTLFNGTVERQEIILDDARKTPVQVTRTNNAEFIAAAQTDIYNLLKEREVLREALKNLLREIELTSGHTYATGLFKSSPNIHFAREALDWKPEA